MARQRQLPRGPQLELAGDLCVAFVNTAGARSNNRQQGVASYAELLTWGQQVGTLSALEAERLEAFAAERPGEAQAACDHISGVRAALARIFLAIAKRADPPAGDLATINQALAAAMPALRLVPGAGGLTLGWGGDENAPDRMLWPVWYAAAEFLGSLRGQPHVRQCAAEDCALFFVDRSPSGRRVWCEMKTCGHRVKSLRYYHRVGKKNRPKNWLYS